MEMYGNESSDVQNQKIKQIEANRSRYDRYEHFDINWSIPVRLASDGLVHEKLSRGKSERRLMICLAGLAIADCLTMYIRTYTIIINPICFLQILQVYYF